MEKEHKQTTHPNAFARFFIHRAELGKKLSDELENDPQDNTQFLWICHHLWPTLLALLITWIVVMVVFGGFGPSQLLLPYSRVASSGWLPLPSDSIIHYFLCNFNSQITQITV